MRKKKTNVVLENIELKPQVLGYTFKKKNNIGRVVFIFVCFILVVYYINDISVFINGLLGKETSKTISSNTTDKNKPNNQDSSKEIVYNIFNNDLSLNESGLVIENFKYDNNILSFDALNNSASPIDLSSKKFFIEIYSEDKTLIQRMKVDFDSINANSKISFNFDVINQFYYLVLLEKTVDDYPIPSYTPNEEGVIVISCTKGNDEIIYSFNNEKLSAIKHTMNDNNINDSDYSLRYLASQNKINNYKGLVGIDATFNGTLNGYSYVISIDLGRADMTRVTDKYYFNQDATTRIVSFEMETYGFSCK